MNMKELLLISVVCMGVTGVAYASSYDCDGTKKFMANLNLDEARAGEVEQILSSYSQVKDLAKSGRHDEVLIFIEEKNAQLSRVLTDEEFAQFKENMRGWAEKMNFSKFKSYAGKSRDESL